MSHLQTSVARRNKKQSLAMRLLDACRQIPTFDKMGSNDEYNYVFASQIFEKFRAALMERDILLLPNEVQILERDIPTVAGPLLRQVTLHVDYELLDCRGLEPSITKHAISMAMDNGDKAIYKAKTGALKYFFRVLGIIPWNERDDPEWDNRIDDQTDPRVFDKGKKKNERVVERQIRAFRSACNASGKTEKQVAEYLEKRFDIAALRDLSKADFNEAIKWASLESNSVDLTDVVRLSAEIAREAAATKKPANGAPQPIVGALDRVDPEESIAGD
jgi:hypothetical protein